MPLQVKTAVTGYEARRQTVAHMVRMLGLKYQSPMRRDALAVCTVTANANN